METKIKGFENYTISDKGEVFSIVRKKTISPFLHRKGYPMVTLCQNGKKRNLYVHRLVAEAFIPNPENKPTINHKNENKLINEVSNLEWLTVEENNAYGTRIQRMIQTKKNKKLLKYY